ncbi:EamA/RhaT family transporter [Pyrococcus furiosus DSM 3638]|uniref:EamA/RhaT family transporter n=3 Tax=Pyrococcus furiosus TaxID=2261 RepID=A0A5C0XRC0_PYRFU|nr:MULTISPECIES: DMT family transporter [Pyrococcus]AAL81795.1 hypothetical protein PF1671 [Pyrococcus furiosus DSM 3638]AFN04969.1 hypothetical protein PFC_10250 [Pyrococcus furiosus COM1]MDK2870570.1 drug/metabolite transporter, family [Pyrococcus sp.]QEK79292.1 EamA/RhaT family transporter [Pyrococcus furiosus DSM 3638]
MIAGILLALGAAFSWALSSVLSKMIMERISPLSLNIVRLLISGLVYLGMFLVLPFPNKPILWWLIVIASGVLGFTVADFMFLKGMKEVGVSRASILVTPHPILTMILAHYFLGRPLNSGIFLGAFLIVLAVIILLSESGNRESKTSFEGVLWIFGAEALWTVAVLLTDWLVENESPLLITGLRIIGGSIGAIFFVPSVLKEVKRISIRDYVWIVIITFLGTVIGQYLFVMAIRLVTSSIATPITESSPIMATILAAFILKEEITERIFISIILAFVGVILIGIFM